MKRFIAAALIGAGALAGACTTSHGTVTETQGANKATVQLGLTGRVAPGDRVDLLETTCASRTPGPVSGLQDCVRKVVGHGVVVSLVDSRTATVRVDPGTKLEPGLTVTKAKEQAH